MAIFTPDLANFQCCKWPKIEQIIKPSGHTVPNDSHTWSMSGFFTLGLDPERILRGGQLDVTISVLRIVGPWGRCDEDLWVLGLYVH